MQKSYRAKELLKYEKIDCYEVSACAGTKHGVVIAHGENVA